MQCTHRHCNYLIIKRYDESDRVKLFLFQILRSHQLIEFITRTNLFGHLEGYALRLLYFIHRLKVDTSLIKRKEESTGSRTGNEQLIAYLHLSCFYQELCHADVGEVTDTFTHIYLSFGSFRAIIATPFAKR